jgi:hypothetical protein
MMLPLPSLSQTSPGYLQTKFLYTQRKQMANSQQGPGHDLVRSIEMSRRSRIDILINLQPLCADPPSTRLPPPDREKMIDAL